MIIHSKKYPLFQVSGMSFRSIFEGIQSYTMDVTVTCQFFITRESTKHIEWHRVNLGDKMPAVSRQTNLNINLVLESYITTSWKGKKPVKLRIINTNNFNIKIYQSTVVTVVELSSRLKLLLVLLIWFRK